MRKTSRKGQIGWDKPFAAQHERLKKYVERGS